MLDILLRLIGFGDALSGALSLFGIESPLGRVKTSEKTLKTSRDKLLRILKRENETRLANSLHELVKLDLRIEDQYQQVGKPKIERVPEDPPNSRKSLFQRLINLVVLCGKESAKPPLAAEDIKKIIEVFDRSDIQGKLLILGEPGSGKTTELLHLAQDLIKQACEDKHCPIPLVLELFAWNGEKIDGWVASQIRKQYNLREHITQKWLEDNQLLLLLDGLDELGLKKQQHCIEAINEFLEENNLPGLVVCCRREEYDAGQIQLDELNGAVYLEALREEQIQQYFADLNRLRLWENVRRSPALVELAQKPLFLFMLVVAYQGQPIRTEKDLFDAYIAKQLHDPRNQGTYPVVSRKYFQTFPNYVSAWIV
ncbi:MAG: NACHT domain-containing protein [Cyanothece sp. SIO1E1]|nr:NACHT domain-containing protein [Cyanothece sp. SIO1E1]